MKVAIAHKQYAGFFLSEFPDAVIIGNGPIPEGVDLLIVTGGEDVNPKCYEQPVTGAFGWDDERDELELKIIKHFIDNTSAKIFGVCRGLQIMNVAQSGDLYQDLVPAHPDVHKLEHRVENPLSWMTVVNSLHHQAVRSIGDRYEKGKALAVDNITRTPEIVSWGDRFLGVQFHPEFYDDQLRTKFFDVIKQWVKGDVSFNVSVPKPTLASLTVELVNQMQEDEEVPYVEEEPEDEGDDE